MADENIDRLLRYCTINQIDKIGVIYCNFHKQEARFLIQEIDGKITTVARACRKCLNENNETNNADGSGIAGDFNAHGTGVNLMLGLCPLQLSRFLKEIRSVSVTVCIRPTFHES